MLTIALPSSCRCTALRSLCAAMMSSRSGERNVNRTRAASGITMTSALPPPRAMCTWLTNPRIFAAILRLYSGIGVNVHPSMTISEWIVSYVRYRDECVHVSFLSHRVHVYVSIMWASRRHRPAPYTRGAPTALPRRRRGEGNPLGRETGGGAPSHPRRGGVDASAQAQVPRGFRLNWC